jgi:plasmid stability protein
MAQLMLRDVDFGLIRLLRQRAAKHGRSPEAEHRAILEQALRGDQQSGASRMEHVFSALGLSGHGAGPKPSPPAAEPEDPAR